MGKQMSLSAVIRAANVVLYVRRSMFCSVLAIMYDHHSFRDVQPPDVLQLALESTGIGPCV